MKLLAITGCTLLILAVAGFGAFAQSDAEYTGFESLFEEYREFQGQTRGGGAASDYTPDKMEQEYRELKSFQKRLADIESSGWTISNQINYHLARAEMNGLEFRHKVTKPWALDPGFYNDILPRVGRRQRLPLSDEGLKRLRTRLQELPVFFEQAKKNLQPLSNVAAGLGTVAVLSLGDSRESYVSLAAQAAELQPELVPDAEKALGEIDGYIDWINANKSKMTAKAGVGKENYNWLMKNVYLFPYTWDDIRTIVELEDNRVITFLKLEQNRNRDVPPLIPAATQEEYKQKVIEAIEHTVGWIKENEIFTVHDYFEWKDYWQSGWHGFDTPWPEKHDYFFNFSHREPVMEEMHEMVAHSWDGQRTRRDPRPNRGGRLPYKISTARGEGYAFALEELMVHAGILDGRNPHGREVAYEQAAFRTVRALSDIYMHSQEWSYEDAYKFCVENAPHGELLDGSHHLWYELDTTLRGVGHHMLMVVGKVQFMKLIRDRAQQLGDEFTLKRFMDEFYATGTIPMALTRWELTGYDDEIKKLW